MLGCILRTPSPEPYGSTSNNSASLSGMTATDRRREAEALRVSHNLVRP